MQLRFVAYCLAPQLNIRVHLRDAPAQFRVLAAQVTNRLGRVVNELLQPIEQIGVVRAAVVQRQPGRHLAVRDAERTRGVFPVGFVGGIVSGVFSPIAHLVTPSTSLAPPAVAVRGIPIALCCLWMVRSLNAVTIVGQYHVSL